MLKAIRTIFSMYSYIWVMLLVLATIVCDQFFKWFTFTDWSTVFSDIVGVSGTFLGFLLTALTVFWAMPKSDIFMKRFMHYHYKIFQRAATISVISFTSSIFMRFIADPSETTTKIGLYLFLLGTFEIMIVFYDLLYVGAHEFSNLERE